jgi:hypothetical protein
MWVGVSSIPIILFCLFAEETTKEKYLRSHNFDENREIAYQLSLEPPITTRNSSTYTDFVVIFLKNLGPWRMYAAIYVLSLIPMIVLLLIPLIVTLNRFFDFCSSMFVLILILNGFEWNHVCFDAYAGWF